MDIKNNENNHNEKHVHSHDVSSIKGGNFIITVLLNFAITAVEIIGGLYSGSLSLISDALHNLSDAIGIIISYIAIKISKKENDKNRTFGYKRSGILAAVINSSVLIIISVFLFKEAYTKFMNTTSINGLIVIWVALIGIVANTLGAYLLHGGSHEDMNVKATYIHLFSDALASLGVVIGGILIYFFKIYWVDSVLSVLIGLYVLKESFEILKDAVNILMQGVPENIEIDKVAGVITSIQGVEDVHHVHLWSLDEKNINFEAHVNVKDMMVSETKEIYEKIQKELHEHFGITHVTIQFECNCCSGVGIIKKN
ncbi:cation diffusion facilitator family transporter [Clostridium akagii]|uniref:cation diffusion facilitator family transporter n=1 Tax=Clostridium akagii TaxID=91623 RepID=UPI00056B5A93|nr:cation diffusion facilitator family transporter [Clostridium akagii]